MNIPVPRGPPSASFSTCCARWRIGCRSRTRRLKVARRRSSRRSRIVSDMPRLEAGNGARPPRIWQQEAVTGGNSMNEAELLKLEGRLNGLREVVEALARELSDDACR